MVVATLTSKGQVTLPKEVREHLQVAAGDRLEFLIAPDGQVQLRTVAGSFRDLRGLLWRPDRTSPTDEALERELTRMLTEDDARIRRGER